MIRTISAVVAFVALALVAAAAPAAPLLLVSVAPSTGSPGQEVDVLVGVKGAANLGALEFRLTFDSAVLEMKKCDPGVFAAAAGILDFKAGDAGKAGMGLASTQGLNGDGDLFKVTFLVRGQPGQKSPLHLEAVRAWEATTVTESLVSVENAEFTVVPGAGGGLGRWIATAIGILALLAVVWLVRRGLAGRSELPASDALPTFTPEPSEFTHRCSKCGQTICLPSTMLARPFKAEGVGQNKSAPNRQGVRPTER
jgi:hypothetical protein